MNTIGVKDLVAFLRLASLDGLLKELVIETDSEGVSVVKAIDMSDIVFVLLSKKIGLPANTDIGFDNVSKIIKYLDMINTETISFDLNPNTIKFDGGKQGKLRLSLLAKEVVPTYVPNTIDEIKSKLLEGNGRVDFTITEEEIKNLLNYINLCGTESINMVCKDKKLTFTGNDTESKSEFELVVGNVTNGESDVTLSTYSKYFASTINNIVKNSSQFTCSIANECPLLFIIDDSIISLTSLSK